MKRHRTAAVHQIAAIFLFRLLKNRYSLHGVQWGREFVGDLSEVSPNLAAYGILSARECALVSRSVPNEIILNDDKFWIVSRNALFGPFDYQWSGDLYGIEFNYQGQKFGEVCSDEEFFADLKPFGLPISVARVAALTAGVIAVGIRSGTSLDERVSHLIALLQQFDLQRFSIRESSPRDP